MSSTNTRGKTNLIYHTGFMYCFKAYKYYTAITYICHNHSAFFYEYISVSRCESKKDLNTYDLFRSHFSLYKIILSFYTAIYIFNV